MFNKLSIWEFILKMSYILEYISRSFKHFFEYFKK